MTDITKCTGVGCKKKETCYRFLAEDGLWQSYFERPPKGKCSYYWKIDKKDVNDENRRQST